MHIITGHGDGICSLALHWLCVRLGDMHTYRLSGIREMSTPSTLQYAVMNVSSVDLNKLVKLVLS